MKQLLIIIACSISLINLAQVVDLSKCVNALDYPGWTCLGEKKEVCIEITRDEDGNLHQLASNDDFSTSEKDQERFDATGHSYPALSDFIADGKDWHIYIIPLKNKNITSFFTFEAYEGKEHVPTKRLKELLKCKDCVLYVKIERVPGSFYGEITNLKHCDIQKYMLRL